MENNKLKILSVDDDMINRRLLKAVLKKMPNVETIIDATNGSEALEILKSDKNIDLVFLDINMPIMGGIETLKIMRADETLSQIPVIVLTTDETRKTDSLETGANIFLTKPVIEKDVQQKIKDLGF